MAFSGAELRAQSNYVTPYAFTTLAGQCPHGSADGPGSAARFYQPSGLGVDGSGNVYVADSDNHTIRKITAGGVVTTLAGSAGNPGSADGTGSAARFHIPCGVAVDGAGNIYVADLGNDTIRKITAAGAVTTLAGSPGVSGSTDGTGSAARFYDPSGVAVDGSGNVYVADSLNNTIREISTAGVVTTLAGSAGVSGSADGTGRAARFHNPTDVALDGTGNIYVADYANHTIRQVTAAGVVTTLAGSANLAGSTDDTGSAARFNHPQSVSVDGSGNIYVADSSNNTIRKITAGGAVTTLAGSAGNPGRADGTGSAALFDYPSGVAVDGAGNVYVGDSLNNIIRNITPGGVVTTLAGSAVFAGSADGTGTAARFYGPQGVAVDGSGNVYVADYYNSTIRKITAAGVVTTLAGSAGNPGIADGPGTTAQFYNPPGVAVDGSGNVYVADYNISIIRKITAGGVVTTLAGSAGVKGSADGTGNAARFFFPSGVAVDGSGNVYIADSSNNTIRKITAAGVVTTLAGSAGKAGSTDGTGSTARFNQPNGVAVDGSGNVYVADSSNNTIRKITGGGVVTTLAGSASTPGSADGTGNAARFYAPDGIAVDGSGIVYVADFNNNTIRKGIDASYVAAGIINQPSRQAVTSGQNASLTVTAGGTPAPTFLWQVSTDGGITWTNLSDNSIYSGSATATLTVTNATVSLSGEQFQCVATNAAGSATSNPATLTVTKATATVTLGSLSQAYTGSAVGATGLASQKWTPIQAALMVFRVGWFSKATGER